MQAGALLDRKLLNGEREEKPKVILQLNPDLKSIGFTEKDPSWLGNSNSGAQGKECPVLSARESSGETSSTLGTSRETVVRFNAPAAVHSAKASIPMLHREKGYRLDVNSLYYWVLFTHVTMWCNNLLGPTGQRQNLPPLE